MQACFSGTVPDAVCSDLKTKRRDISSPSKQGTGHPGGTTLINCACAVHSFVLNAERTLHFHAEAPGPVLYSPAKGSHHPPSLWGIPCYILIPFIACIHVTPSSDVYSDSNEKMRSCQAVRGTLTLGFYTERPYYNHDSDADTQHTCDFTQYDNSLCYSYFTIRLHIPPGSSQEKPVHQAVTENLHC